VGYAFYTIEQAKQFAFYQIPKALFRDEFADMTNDERMLYAFMRDRSALSEKNGWVDEEGHIYIIFTIDEIKEEMCCASEKATKILKKLEDRGLIERKRRGLGLPSITYVKNFAERENPDDSSDFRKSKISNFENRNSCNSEIENPDVRKSKSNNTDTSDTETNKNNNTCADAPDLDVVVRAVKNIVKEDITDQEALAIAKEAGYDLSLVKAAYRTTEKSTDISNLVGYMIAAIRNGYKEPISKKKSTNSFQNFEERHTDYDALFAKKDSLSRKRKEGNNDS